MLIIYFKNAIMKKLFLILFSVLTCYASTSAQTATPLYDIVVKGGHVIDPKNGIDQVIDIAVKQGKIVKVEKNINGADAKQVVDATDLIVSPGLIDLHSHVFAGTQPDHYLSDGLSA
jgi:dihydroorotase